MSNVNYGFEDDKSKSGPALNFGLNSAAGTLIKFGYNPNGGKDGVAQEVLDIVFSIGGKEISYRMFPVTKAFGENNTEVIDPAHPKFQEAVKEFNASVVHIMKAFVPVATLKTALSMPISNFQQFCNICTNLLPANGKEIKLDFFGQWQWKITGENNTTFVNLPRNVKHGKWLCAHIAPVGGEWKESKVNGLKYVDEAENEHPFTRNKWYMDSNFAKQQKEESVDDVDVNTVSNGSENREWS